MIKKQLQTLFKNIPEAWYQEIVDNIKVNIYDRFYSFTPYKREVRESPFGLQEIIIKKEEHYTLSHYLRVEDFLEELSGEHVEFKDQYLHYLSHIDAIREYIYKQTTILTKKVIAHSLLLEELDSKELYEYFSHYNKEIYKYISLPIEEILTRELEAILQRLLFVFLSSTKEIKERIEMDRMIEEMF